MKRVFIITLAVLAALLSAVIPSCSPGSASVKTETLTIAAVPTELNALVYIAEDQNLFTRNGLQVILKDYDSGATAAAGMLNGEAEVALAAEFPIVRQVFNKKDIINLGTVTKYENTYIMWRTDSGIKTIQDLRGKRIGVTFQTISEFYLGRTLDLNCMKLQQVTVINTKAADAEKSIVNREIDAVVTWEPWVAQINQRLGKEVVTMPLQSSQYGYWNLVSTAGWIAGHPDTIGKLLKSLVQAERYAAGHQDKAKAALIKRMNFGDAYLETIWPRYQFSLSLDQSLILAMEDEARWLMSNNLTAGTAMPDFADYIYTDGLKALKPAAVRITGK